MRSFRWYILAAVPALLALAVGAAGQQRAATSHAGYVYPAGGRQGSSFDVTVGGQFLAGVTGAHISGQGVQASLGGYDRPLTQREVLLLRDRLDEARKKLDGDSAGTSQRPGLRRPLALMRLAREAGITDEELRKLAEFQQSRIDPKKQLNPQIEEKVTLHITVAPDAVPGARDLRLVTPTAVTNPLRFEVGTLPECRESEPNDRVPDTAIGATLPMVINGQILPGDVDRFAFTARKGMRIVASVSARELMPYLADAVPGWFQPVVTIRDANGHELACADHYLFHPDPVVCCTLPRDGAYTLEIRDSLFRGREDFVYRATLGEIPFVTRIFPLGGPQHAPVTVALNGWNLSQNRLTIDTQRSGTIPVRVGNGRQPCNGVPFAVDTLPERLEKEPNDTRANAQKVSLPLVINGRIDRPGDVDVFAFEGRAGAKVVAEVNARRLGSPLDSALRLTDAHGREITANDDYDDGSDGCLTHHADSRILVKLPAAGTYYLALRDVQQKGGDDYAYRLRISAPRPDVELCIVPSSLSARAGSTVPITVRAIRKDGFDGDITLALQGAPPGFALSGARIPAGQDRVRLTLTVPALGSLDPFSLQMEGRVVAERTEVRRPVAPAEDMMQAFAYHRLVPAQEWLVSVYGRSGFRTVAQPPDGYIVKLPVGGTARIPLPGLGKPALARLQFALNEPPDGITLQLVTDAAGMAFLVRANAAKVKPGLKGNLIIDAFSVAAPPAVIGKPAAGARRFLAATLPAIPFEVVAP